MRLQTAFAYIGAMVIVVGAAVMIYSPNTYYRLDGAAETAERANGQVQHAQKVADATAADRN